MVDLLVIVPIRSRPHNARKVLAAWDETGAWDDAALVFVADADDPQIAQYRRIAAERSGDGKHWWIVELPEWQPMVPKLDQTAVREAGRFPALAFMGDDHLPRTRGWARVFLGTLAELGTGIVYGDDLHRGESLATHWAMTADIVRALGRMVPAPVRHQFSDRSVMDLGRALGCLRYLPQVVVEHMHYAAGKAVKDEIYAAGNRQRGFEADERAYEEWLRDGLGRDVAAIRAVTERANEPDHDREGDRPASG